MPSDIITVTASHIHEGTLGENGALAFPLYTGPAITVTLGNELNFFGSITLDPAEAATLMSGGYYINIHTTDNPAGEIRGQVIADINGDGAGNQYYVDELAMRYELPLVINRNIHHF